MCYPWREVNLSMGNSALVLLQEKVFHSQGNFWPGWVLMKELALFHLGLDPVWSFSGLGASWDEKHRVW